MDRFPSEVAMQVPTTFSLKSMKPSHRLLSTSPPLFVIKRRPYPHPRSKPLTCIRKSGLIPGTFWGFDQLLEVHTTDHAQNSRESLAPVESFFRLTTARSFDAVLVVGCSGFSIKITYAKHRASAALKRWSSVSIQDRVQLTAGRWTFAVDAWTGGSPRLIATRSRW